MIEVLAFVSLALIALSLLALMFDLDTGPTASPKDFGSKIEVELYARDGWVNFRYRARRPAPPFEWEGFSLRTPEGVEVECGGDDSVRTYQAGDEWSDFYVDCGSWKGPGVYRLLFKGLEIDRRVLTSSG